MEKLSFKESLIVFFGLWTESKYICLRKPCLFNRYYKRVKNEHSCAACDLFNFCESTKVFLVEGCSGKECYKEIKLFWVK